MKCGILVGGSAFQLLQWNTTGLPNYGDPVDVHGSGLAPLVDDDEGEDVLADLGVQQGATLPKIPVMLETLRT